MEVMLWATRVETTAVLRLGGWTAYASGVVATIGLVFLIAMFGALPHGVRMGLLAATYIGYPIWAFWLGRHLLRDAALGNLPAPENGTER
ncbi:MAG: hypothetical protein DLM71_00190 [Chloroflexi bacterium]|nr:MAG: hypothetical protein DLM71_00190 [Chloroflexota bacterium]